MNILSKANDIIAYFIFYKFNKGTENYYKSVFIILMSYFIICSGTVSSAVFYFLNLKFASYLIFINVLFLIATLFIIKITGNIQISSQLFLLSTYITIIYLSTDLGGIKSPSLIWLAPLCLFVAVTLQKKFLFFWLVMIQGCLSTFYILEFYGFSFKNKLVGIDDSWMQFSVLSLLFLIILLFTLMYRYIFEEKVSHLTLHDRLTNLPNRKLFLEHIKHSLLANQRNGKYISILYFDIDNFKLVNEAHGHSDGDKVLVGISRRIEAILRKEDIIARLGNDEFVILLSPLEKVEYASIVADKINKEIEKPILENQQVEISCSIGISFYPQDGNDPEQLLKKARLSMYQARKSGKEENFKTFKSMYQDQLSVYISLKHDIKEAIQQKKFQAYYQAKLDINKKLVGMEALIRWVSPQQGIISPNQFIPIAEETGLIVDLGEWILEEACLQNKKWQEMGYPPIKVSINVSPFQLHNRLVEILQRVLMKTNLSSNYIQLEITESATIEDFDKTTDILQKIHSLGIEIAIDDFGTGFSSLNYLSRLPIDVLKIDKSFIDSVTYDYKAASMVRLIINMANSLNLTVVAEGIETEEQYKLLKTLGVDELQGYLFSKPLHSFEFTEYIAKAKNISDTEHPFFM